MKTWPNKSQMRRHGGSRNTLAVGWKAVRVSIQPSDEFGIQNVERLGAFGSQSEFH